jgi:hypothetical protein
MNRLTQRPADPLEFHGLFVVSILLALALPGFAQGSRVIAGHVISEAAALKPVGPLPATNHLNLVLGLPLRNQPELDGLLRDLQDPASTNYHQWLTPEQFTERFGPTVEDYQKVVGFAQASGLKVTSLTANRMLVDVEAPVTNIEKAFSVVLRSYPHPREPRNFYAPDTEPTVPADVPILHISGLDNFILPHRLGGALKPAPLKTNSIAAFYTGSAPGGNFMGNDFRAAYVPGVTNTGAGQYVAIIDVGGPYYMRDVYMYQTNAHLSTNIVLTNILLSGWTGIPNGTNADDGEEALDICMAMSMAPGATILNYEGGSDDVFNQIAMDNKAKQMTLSYGFGLDANNFQSFQQFLAQGQAMSQASGDGDADLDGGTGLTGNPYATIVGGTTLTTSSAGGPWSSEVVWNWNNNGGSGGGISGYGIPNWQQGISMTSNLGSTANRNYPDVAMPADGVFLISRNGTAIGSVGGTSCASPLWAGFMALVNQRAATLGKPAVGFANPPIYAIGKGPSATYTKCFHDITSGNNYNSQNPTRFPAATGYDLCTGWGTPTGSNTIAALAADGTNDFDFYLSQGKFNLVAGASANATITMTRMNGLAGSAAFSITGMPTGITATISPASTPNTTTLTVVTRTNTLPGSYTATLTGTLGSLTHSVTLNFVVIAPIPGATQVNLASYYNRTGIYSDGRTFTTGVDGSYSAYSANLLGSTLSWNGLVFNLGPSNAADVVYCASQSISLPAGRFNTLQLLATGVQGNQMAQTFIVTYTDNSTVTFTQSFSDWANPQAYSGESTAFTMPYRDLNGGGTQTLNVKVYGYTFNLDQTRTVKSLTLPSNANLVLLSVILANDPVSAPLASYYNRAGIYTDGTTFTNPATGGMDGGGYAYSGSLLGGSQTWSNTVFNFGPVNATNVISATSQAISLPAGNDANLRMLAASVNGGQASQSFVVTYTDATSTTFVQSLSDWNSPQSYAGESKAIIMGHRNSSAGTAGNRTFYLYGYSFALNSAKTVQSIRLPNNPNVIVAAISLVPNWPPTFGANPFTLASVNAGQSYAGNIATNASDLNGGTLTYGKVSGPAWLNVGSVGSLTGVPANSDANTNTFVVSVKDTGGLSNTATLYIYVNGAPSFTVNPFSMPPVTAGQTCSGTIATNATDPNPGDALMFAKVSGPAWLAVGANGALSGTPFSSNVGNNSFVVSVTDPGGLSNSAAMNIAVAPAPPIVSAISFQAGSLALSWSGGIAPYQVQATADLINSDWQVLAGTINGNSFLINSNSLLFTPSRHATFYRIVGQ